MNNVHPLSELSCAISSSIGNLLSLHDHMYSFHDRSNSTHSYSFVKFLLDLSVHHSYVMCSEIEEHRQLASQAILLDVIHKIVNNSYGPGSSDPTPVRLRRYLSDPTGTSQTKGITDSLFRLPGLTHAMQSEDNY